MRFGTTVRNMGPAATTDCMRHCAASAEAAGLAHIWVVDHVAIPPDDAEGSEGRWIDPLAALAYFAAATTTIELGVSVLVLPYRAPLITAKWIASIQELSKARLHLGIGPGWMDAEYQVLGVDKKKRGVITDQTIDFINECFAASDDVVVANEQAFLFRPRPAKPPIYVGGMEEVALRRAVRCGDGWLPIGINAEKLKPKIARLEELCAEAGRGPLKIVLIGSLPDDQSEAADLLGQCAELGASDYIQSSRYAEPSEFDAIMERLLDLKTQI
ncbi:MAG: TIGR03619 family F420-dependent LLM class oxidoreductase [Pseudomonadota bacterium]